MGNEYVEYRVKAGETLQSIAANYYHLTDPAQIRQVVDGLIWANGLQKTSGKIEPNSDIMVMTTLDLKEYKRITQLKGNPVYTCWGSACSQNPRIMKLGTNH